MIEAAFPGGVRVVQLEAFVAHASKFEILTLPARDPAAVIAAARSQVGKPYDWAGVCGIGFRRRWQDDDAWFCSELVAGAFALAGEPLFRAQAWRITPRDLSLPLCFAPAEEA